MQTFLPYPDFAESARVLDRARLGKQRVEALQLCNTLAGQSFGWQNHPCIKMWRGHLPALVQYGVAMCNEWHQVRGYADTVREKLLALVSATEPTKMPSWLGREDFHSSHRANLLRKDPKWYGQFGWQDCPLLYYVWPVA